MDAQISTPLHKNPSKPLCQISPIDQEQNEKAQRVLKILDDAKKVVKEKRDLYQKLIDEHPNIDQLIVEQMGYGHKKYFIKVIQANRERLLRIVKREMGPPPTAVDEDSVKAPAKEGKTRKAQQNPLDRMDRSSKFFTEDVDYVVVGGRCLRATEKRRSLGVSQFNMSVN